MSDLHRFVDAQQGVHERALVELTAGDKRSHWMWFVFPQLAGLGRSDMARRYALASLDEARDYLAHPVLGPRLRECTRAVLGVRDRTAERILGGVDAQKLRSSMTLFALAAPDETLFREVLDRYYDGRADPLTEELLAT